MGFTDVTIAIAISLVIVAAVVGPLWSLRRREKTTAVAEPVSPPQSTCPDCGSVVTDAEDEKFCYNCGYYLTEECPGCSQSLLEWEDRYAFLLKFCPLCGYALQKTYDD